MTVSTVMGQAVDSTKASDKIVDVVWLKDGSKLSGYILKWELARGMEFKLITGAEVILPKDQITRVYQIYLLHHNCRRTRVHMFVGIVPIDSGKKVSIILFRAFSIFPLSVERAFIIQ